MSQKQRIQNLEREVERRDLNEKRLEEIVKNGTTEALKEKQLISDLKKKEDQLSEQRNQLHQTLTQLKQVGTILEETIYERDLERRTRQYLEGKAKENQTRIKKLEQIHDKIVMPQKQRIQSLEREVERRDLNEKRLEEIVKNRTTEALKEKQLISDLNKKEDQLSEIRNQLHQTLTQLKQVGAILEETISERDIERRTRQYLEGKAKENQTRIKELEQIHDKIVMQQRQRIQSLEREFDRHELNKKRLEEIVALKEKQLICDLKTKEDQLSEQRNPLLKALTKLKQVAAKLYETESVRDIERHARLDLERKAKLDHIRIKDLDQINDRIVWPQKQRIQYLESELKRRGIKVKELEDKLEETKAEVGSGNELGDVLMKRENQSVELEHQLKNILVKLKQTETELEEKKTRLNKAMGDRLANHNPIIADLSDTNRPFKLAEKYSELYDNQWADAFDSLGKYFDREQSTIEGLLEILQDAMQFCLASGSKQMKDLQSVLGLENTYERDVPTDVLKYLKDSRKAMSSIPVRNLYEKYLTHLKRSAPQTLGRTLEVMSFVQECLEICWLMVIQDPPVVFAPVAKSGSELNTDIFKPYTRSGSHVEYTVWPALLLHEGGPVLAKGVAQGYRKKSSTSVLSR